MKNINILYAFRENEAKEKKWEKKNDQRQSIIAVLAEN